MAIVSPLDDATFDSAEPLSFCAQVDDEDDLGALQIVVQSNLGGTLWTTGDSTPAECAGGNFGIELSVTGESQTIGISVVDQKGQAATAQVRVVPAVNSPPWCSIGSPATGSTYEIDDLIPFEALVGDDDSDPATLELVLASDFDGVLWEGNPDSSGVVPVTSLELTGAAHQITLQVTDDHGRTAGCGADVTVNPCVDADADGVTVCDGDCDDSDPTAFPGGVEVVDGADNDCDGEVDDNTEIWDDDHDGYSEYDGDCDDTDATISPDAFEIWYNGVDEDCDGQDDDQDGDGFVLADDCDDTDPDVNPLMAEVWYDGTDQDCDGNDDDFDLDGYAVGDDCDDTDRSVNPGAAESWYDGVDQDCDGRDDDQDSDGYLRADDCDDLDATVNVGQAEIWYDGIDQDCDGNDIDQDGDGVAYTVDCDDTDAAINGGEAEIWYDGIDQDCDGNDTDQDEDGSDYTLDCDDTSATVYPGATEIWYDGVDQDCASDDDYDQDADGYDRTDDCDDTDAARSPGLAEVWYDGVDQDCDGNDTDQDEDGYAYTVDCDDTAAQIHPGATETWYDGVDQDCDGADDDQDGDGYVLADDCDDEDDSVNPGESEVWYDGVDQDCDGNDLDQDEDGWDVSDDCDDTNALMSPALTEIRDGYDNDCDDLCDEGLVAEGELIITEIMKDPVTTSDTYGEWFEVYNASTQLISMCGWEIADDDGETVTMSGTVSLSPGEHAVFARDDNTGLNDGVVADYEYGSGLQLGNSGDEVVLYNDGDLIDRVAYTTSFPNTSGYSLSLDPDLYNDVDNDSAASWCRAATYYGAYNRGTPGSTNPQCP